MRKSILTVAAIGGIFAGAWSGYAADTPAPTRIRGTITAVEGSTVSVGRRDEGSVSIRFTDPATVMTVKRVPLSSITSGSYVGIAAEPDGKEGYRALEVLVFPEAMRGAGEGHTQWDLKQGSSMTNGTVSGTVDGSTGRDLDITYKGEKRRIAVPPDAPVVTLVPAQWSDVRQGAKVFLSAVKQPDGSYAASRITVGKDGVDPPM